MIVLSVVPLSVIPPPLAPASLGLVTEPSSKFLSSYVTVVELIVVVVPFTVRSPAIVTLFANETASMVVVVVVPFTVRSPAIVTLFANEAASVVDNRPAIFVFAPTQRFLATPSPPETFKAPVVVLDDSVVFVILIADPVVAPRLVTVESVLVS